MQLLDFQRGGAANIMWSKSFQNTRVVGLTQLSFVFVGIVFDTAPTGHTLRLLGFPAILERGLGKLQGYSARVVFYLKEFSSL